ncbi:MAG TPA: GTPase Era [Firmicutes bacterium]|jgi:GTP-binding protein Era|nr:GTPase Era [Bacillota bacterium]HOQ24204.1 GTPase Era [Bacillota bacterium]HPT67636.1 GTPase Era [Bacillota bacterium]
MSGYRSGFVTLIGRPNVGKSSLLNRLVGQKVAIISDKPQTTRRQIQGVLTGDGFQVVFVDTPGLHRPKHRLGENMNRQAIEALEAVDLVLWVLDPNKPVQQADAEIAERLKGQSSPVYAVFNKADLPVQVEPEEYLKACNADFPWLKVSALTGVGIEHLLAVVQDHLPEGPQYYPDGVVTDHPEQFIAAELIREAILRHTEDEVPHSVAVVIDEMTARSNGKVYIRAEIFGERESQKGILIGAQGRLLKEIGAEARREIEALLGSPVYLDLWVKAKKDWRNSDAILKRWGLD